MAQYAIDPTLLTPYLPAGLDLDLYQGQCYVSLVGFLFTRVRLKRIAIPFHTSFEEVNLRFYVRRHLPDGTSRRGVVFLSEIVPKPAITLVARALYGEAYSTARTRHTWTTTPTTFDVQLRLAPPQPMANRLRPGLAQPPIHRPQLHRRVHHRALLGLHQTPQPLRPPTQHRRVRRSAPQLAGLPSPIRAHPSQLRLPLRPRLRPPHPPHPRPRPPRRRLPHRHPHRQPLPSLSA